MILSEPGVACTEIIMFLLLIQEDMITVAGMDHNQASSL